MWAPCSLSDLLMPRILVFALLFAVPLAANDVAVSTPDGNAIWLLLEPPPGPGGDGYGEFAGDPGLPVPDLMGRTGSWPVLDLWRFDTAAARYSRVTQVAANGIYPFAVFELGGEPYLVAYQAGTGVPRTLVLRAKELAAPADAIPAAAVALASSDFADAAAVSPDGSRIVLRAFPATGAVLRVYRATDWKLEAESGADNWSRPVWIDNATLACIAHDGSVARVGLGVGGVKPTPNDNPAPVAGRLVKLDLAASGLAQTELLKGDFPPETFTRALSRDIWTRDLIVARKDGDRIVVEQRGARPGAVPVEIARFEHFRGIAMGGGVVRCAGVSNGGLEIATLRRWGTITLPALPGARPVIQRLPVGNQRAVSRDPVEVISPSGLGGLIDLRRGMIGLLEPVANPDYVAPGQPLCLHTLSVPWSNGCDSMRNTRNLARVSGLVKRFAELDALYPRGIPSTLLAFEMTINLPEVKEKKGSYVELYHGDGRAGNGRIRTEDNLSGDWVVNSIDGGGSLNTDNVYTWADIKAGTLDKKTAVRAGKLYDDLATQLEVRKLLMLGGIARSPDAGGLRFLGHGTRLDIASGLTLRVWRFEKLGRALPDGGRERVELSFVAELPAAKRGSWACPHGLIHANMTFAVANQSDSKRTSVSFSPATFVSLPNLTNPSWPALILPREYRIHDRDKDGKFVERFHARALAGETGHPAPMVDGGKLTPGYHVPSLSVPVQIPSRADKQFRELLR